MLIIKLVFIVCLNEVQSYSHFAISKTFVNTDRFVFKCSGNEGMEITVFWAHSRFTAAIPIYIRINI